MKKLVFILYVGQEEKGFFFGFFFKFLRFFEFFCARGGLFPFAFCF